MLKYICKLARARPTGALARFLPAAAQLCSSQEMSIIFDVQIKLFLRFFRKLHGLLPFFALLLLVLPLAAVITMPMLLPDITAFQRCMALGSEMSVLTVKR